MATTRHLSMHGSSQPVAVNADGNISVNTGYPIKEQTLSEILDMSINELEIRLANVKKNKELIHKYEKQFKVGDIVFSKETGPALFNKLILVNESEYYKEPFPTNINFGDVAALIQTLNGRIVVKIDNLVPYTENVKLLYESERNNSND